MSKFIFIPNAEIIIKNGKNKDYKDSNGAPIKNADGENISMLDNLLQNILPTYGIVEPYNELDYKDLDTNRCCIFDVNDDVVEETISIEEHEEVKALLAEAIARAELAEQELQLYAPIILAHRDMTASDKKQIKILSDKLSAGEKAQVELDKYRPLIEAHKSMQGG